MILSVIPMCGSFSHHSMSSEGCLPYVRVTCVPSLTEQNIYLLGGQHFIGALKKLREFCLDKGTPENDLPKSLKCVELEILHSTTPIHVRKFLAGQHQQGQRGRAPTAADFFSQLLTDALSKKDILDAHRMRDLGVLGMECDDHLPPPPMDRLLFSDAQLWVLLQRSGLREEDESPGNKKRKLATDTMSQTQVEAMAKAAVCFEMHHPHIRVIPICSHESPFHRRSKDSIYGGTSVPCQPAQLNLGMRSGTRIC